MNLMMGGDNDKVDDYGNENDIDDNNDNRKADGSEGDVGGDTYDDDAADDNYVSIYYSAYTADADNDNADDYTKYGNNVGMDEVPMPLMILTLIMMMISLKPNMV